MKIKEGYNLVKIGESSYLLESQEFFNKIITFNSSAAFLWESVKGKSFDLEDLASLLVHKYGIGHESALNDASSIVDGWKKVSIIKDSD